MEPQSVFHKAPGGVYQATTLTTSAPRPHGKNHAFYYVGSFDLTQFYENLFKEEDESWCGDDKDDSCNGGNASKDDDVNDSVKS